MLLKRKNRHRTDCDLKRGDDTDCKTKKMFCSCFKPQLTMPITQTKMTRREEVNSYFLERRFSDKENCNSPITHQENMTLLRSHALKEGREGTRLAQFGAPECDIIRRIS